MRNAFLALSLMLPVAAYAAPAGMPVVVDGRAAAVVVVPDEAVEVVRYAAEELNAHVEKATGCRLPVAAESALADTPRGRIFLGDCRAARRQGIVAGHLPPETFRLVANGSALFIAGCDGGKDPLSGKTSAGTLFGVYEWLEQVLKARWLWPGDLGTWVPKTPTVIAPPMNLTVAPRFRQRKVRAGLDFESKHPALGFTKEASARYARQVSVFLRRHRMGQGVPLSYGHAFTDWWEKSGEEHAEWFQLREDGGRGPRKPGQRYSMCVSNPGLQAKIVELWLASGGKSAMGPTFINAVENDIPGQCACEACRAWDGPAPPEYARFVSPHSKAGGAPFASDRYARFWLAVQQLAAKENPNAAVVGYAYFNYFAAPTSGVKLNPNILIGYRPSGGCYPRAPREQEWYQRQWAGWAGAGARLFSRTNYLLDGYCMPFLFAHQFADDFQYAARAGMVATDFDSLTGQWSTQGPNLYLLMRLHARPEAAPDDLLAEYYGAFGAAAPQVRAYFEYWEKHTMALAPRISGVFEEARASRWRTWAKAAHRLFPPECFPPAEAILAKAAAAGDAQAAARVEFVRKGLAHARLCARGAGLLSVANHGEPGPEAQAALEELMRYRRATEKEGIANYNHLAWIEDLSWKLPGKAEQPPELYP